MGIISSSSPEVAGLKGLHLYHYALSNCSQKVRFCLEEKELPWTSHVVDLGRHEQATPEYVAINPKAVVPTLVHDGVVVTESSDIIDYLDKHFPAPALRPTDPAELERLYRSLTMWDELQISLKTLSHHLLFKQRADTVRPHMAQFESVIKHNDELLEFLREYTSEKGLSPQRVERATHAVDHALSELNKRLTDHKWIAGDSFSIADVAWSIDVHRFQLMKFPMDQYTAMLEWYHRVESRPAFKKMVVDYEIQVLKSFTG